MTTYVNFTPSASAAFQFQATLDGQIYNVVVTWNLFGQRYYINVYDLSNNRIVSQPMLPSPIGYNLNLVGGYFTTSSLVWRVDNNQFEISP